MSTRETPPHSSPFDKNSESCEPKHQISTQCVQLGRDPQGHFGFVNTPIYRGSTVHFPTMEALLKNENEYTYATKGTPTIRALEEAWTHISGAKGTVLTSSGLAAVSIALLTAVKAGDHLLMSGSVYGPTRSFCDHILKRLGVTTTYYDPCIGEGIEALFQENTTAVFTESPGSLTFEVQDIPAISAVAHAHNAVVLMDNTWATPLFFSPHAHGVDLAIDAGTKYLGGHADILLGQVSANEKMWPELRKTFDAFAICAGPEDAFLALRGLRTLPMRLKEVERQGLAMAHWLKARPEVERVLHPALPDCAGHEIWQRDFTGSTGLFSVELKPTSQQAVAAMLDGLTLFKMGYSWGGFESLVIPFDTWLHRAKEQWNPQGPCLRFQIGFEDVHDLQHDLELGFDRLRLGSA
jgi:cysteine-S-conjugate beta-lyase